MCLTWDCIARIESGYQVWLAAANWATLSGMNLIGRAPKMEIPVEVGMLPYSS